MPDRGMNRFKISENFSLHEFQCQGGGQGTCSCDNSVKVHPDLVDLLQKAREMIGKPMRINSGFRCPDHNSSDAVNGSPISQHMKGYAADISARYLGLSVDELADMCKEFGAVRVGKYPEKEFVHVSVRKQIVDGVTRSNEWTIHD